MSHTDRKLGLLRGLVGLIAGSFVGHYTFFLLTRQGLYALVLPGAILGLGCGLLSGIRSNVLAAICAISAVLLSLFIEWQFAPFNADDSLAYFFKHVHQLKPMTLLMIAMGVFFAFRFGQGRNRGVEKLDL